MSGLSVHDRQLLQEAVDSARTAATETAHTRGVVETLVTGSDELFSRMRAAEKDIGILEVRQKDCGAAKAHAAGSLPGNKSERTGVLIMVVAGVCGAVGSVVAAVLGPIFGILIQKIFN